MVFGVSQPVLYQGAYNNVVGSLIIHTSTYIDYDAQSIDGSTTHCLSDCDATDAKLYRPCQSLGLHRCRGEGIKACYVGKS